MKKIISVLLTLIVITSFCSMAIGCSDSSSSSGSSGSGYDSKYDRDAEYVGDQFGKSSDEVKDSVDRMAGAMR